MILILLSPQHIFIQRETKLRPVDTGRKLNVHKAFRRRPGSLLNVLYTFNLRPASTGISETKTWICSGLIENSLPHGIKCSKKVTSKNGELVNVQLVKIGA